MRQPDKRIYLETLEEIAGSDDLMEAFASETERDHFVPAPHDFTDSVLKRSRALDVQVAAKTRQASRKLQLLTYSLRVGTAVAGALFLLFSIPSLSDSPRFFTGQQRVERHIVQRTDQLSDSLFDFSYQLFHWR